MSCIESDTIYQNARIHDNASSLMTIIDLCCSTYYQEQIFSISIYTEGRNRYDDLEKYRSVVNLLSAGVKTNHVWSNYTKLKSISG